MQTRSLWFVGAFVFALGGCIIGYPLDQYETEASLSASSASSSSGGGEGGSNSSSSSGGGSGLGGAGGAGGGVECPNPDTPLCAMRNKACLTDCFKLDWTGRAGNAYNAYAHSVAIDSRGGVAIAGEYHNVPVNFDGNDTNILPATEAMGTNFNEGFVAYYAFNGDPAGQLTWAEPLDTPNAAKASDRIARGVAFDSENNLIVVGQEKTNSSTVPHVFISKYPAGLGNVSTPMWTRKNLALEMTETTAYAVATFGTNIYVFGRSAQNMSEFMCGNNNVTLANGMFIAKYDKDNSCQWIRSFNTSSMASVVPVAITARNADTNGVWITGHSGSTIVMSDIPPLSFSPMGQHTFVMGLSEIDGAPLAGAFVNDPGIFPTGIETTGTGSGGSTTLFMTGIAVQGTKLTKLEPNQRAGFLLRLNVTGMADPSAGSATIAKHHVFVGATPTSSARTNGVVMMNDRLYVAGAFSESLLIPSNSSNAAHDGITPFFATMDALGENWLTFNAFNTVGEVQPFDEAALAIAGNASKIALAGGWANKLDLTTPDNEISGYLPRATSGTNHEIFVSRFTAP